MFLADTLSSAFPPNGEVSEAVHELEEIEALLPVSGARWRQIEVHQQMILSCKNYD